MLRKIATSIRTKLLLLILAVTFIALFASGVSLIVYEARTYHERWVTDLESQADLLGRSTSAALAFGDEKTARENLELLRSRSAILAAAVYDERGVLFASFARDAKHAIPANIAAQAPGVQVERAKIRLVRAISEGGAPRGHVYLLANYGLAERVASYAGILATVMLLSLAAAVLIGSWLQRKITEPILAIAETANRVIDTRDFSLRVEKKSSDEVGYLVDAFNSMLAEIGVRAEALVAADRMKDHFLATLAHELRNPLAPISNGLHILRARPARPEVAEAAQGMMERQVKQLVRLVDDLLDVSRITTGKLTLRREYVALGDILKDAIALARPLIDLHGHELAVNLPETPIMMRADGTRLAQVFSNLLNNAAKYTDPGGRIELSVREDPDSVSVEVSDTGIGIAPDLLPEMFKMFTQADTALERKTQSGLGVGLALAKRLVELHDGTIEAHSDGIGHGTRFIVRLPTAGASRSVTQTLDATDAGMAKGHKVVIVDDNADFASSLATILEDLGMQVRVAHDGPEGLLAVDAFSPAITFLDIGLPRMSGYEVARRLRATAAGQSLVLVAVTGWGQDADKAAASAAGFDLHVVKPLDPAQLGPIFDLIARRRAGSGTQSRTDRRR